MKLLLEALRSLPVPSANEEKIKQVLQKLLIA
jgi:hypothetical protein